MPSLARASCAAPPALEAHLDQADFVFVGVVDGLDNRSRTATFVVIEQWKGEPLAPRVVVHGGPDDPSTFSSVDRTYEARARYLVAANGSRERLQDNSCTATQEWDAALGAARPAGARMMAEPGTPDRETPDSSIPGQLLIVGAAAIALVGAGLLAFLPRGARRARRTP